MHHKLSKRLYPYVKKSFKTQHGRIPIDPAISAAIRHRFIVGLSGHTQRRETRYFISLA